MDASRALSSYNEEERIPPSDRFRFIVGHEKAVFNMHAARVADLSRPMKALVEGGFQESAERTVKWPSVDVVTFQSFEKFTYTGMYDTPSFMPPNVSREFEEQHHGPDLRQPPSLEGPTLQTTPNDAWLEFMTAYDAGADSTKEQSEILRGHPQRHDRVFIHHVNVAILADQYCIDQLVWLARTKLHQCLKFSTFVQTRVQDAVSLVAHCYRVLAPEWLRKYIAHFAVCRHSELKEDSDYVALVGSDRELRDNLEASTRDPDIIRSVRSMVHVPSILDVIEGDLNPSNSDENITREAI